MNYIEKVYDIRSLLEDLPKLKVELDRGIKIHHSRRFVDGASNFVVRSIEKEFEYVVSPIMRFLYEDFITKLDYYLKAKILDSDDGVYVIDGKIVYLIPIKGKRMFFDTDTIHGIKTRGKRKEDVEKEYNFLMYWTEEWPGGAVIHIAIILGLDTFVP
jgi:hypothetical protein